MGVEFKWNKSEKSIVKEVLRLPEGVLFMANEWRKLYDPFVPMDTGTLAHDAVQTYVEGDEGINHHSAPYAHKQYDGTGFTFSKEKHPLASAKWDQAAKSAGKAKELVEIMQAYVRRQK